MNSASIDSKAFDAFAADYDHDFTHSTLGQLLRPRVWAKLAHHFRPGDHVLELACGTGEDAVWLAKQGIRVTATDGSAAMVEQAKAKAEAEGVTDCVSFVQYALQEVVSGQRSAVSNQSPISNLQSPISSLQSPVSNLQFSGLFSNFGGLNTINHWRDLAASLSRIVEPGGKAILVPMGPICPWEIGWHLLHGQPKIAFRRFGPATATIGEATIPIWYPSAKRLRTDFAPWFRHIKTESLGLFLPPSYLDHFVERRPAVFARLNKLEKMVRYLARDWGDHYIITFERSHYPAVEVTGTWT